MDHLHSSNVIDPLKVQEKTFVQSIDWLHEIDSTNSYVIQKNSASQRTPWLVGCDLQTLGRGRGENRWWGVAGSLTFSVILSPKEFKIETQHWPLMSLMVGLAIRECLTEFIDQQSVELKWPNDVYVDEKKICGILIETIPAQRDLVVIGIGLNVNNSLKEAPLDVRAKATSLAEVVEKELSQEEVLISLLSHLNIVLEQFSNRRTHLIQEWKNHCFLTGKRVMIDDSLQQFTGECLGIDDGGCLILQTQNGQQKVLAGTVTLL